MEKTKEKVKAVFEALKQLDIKATPENVSIMNGVYVFLKEIYAELEKEQKNGGNGNGRPEDHPE